MAWIKTLSPILIIVAYGRHISITSVFERDDLSALADSLQLCNYDWLDSLKVRKEKGKEKVKVKAHT